MTEVPVGGQVLLLDDEDFRCIVGRALYVGQNGYVHAGHYMVHHLVMGGPRDGFHIDHENGNKLDCRKKNLRFVSYQENQINRKELNSNNKSGVRGVSWDRVRGNWRVQIMAHRKNYFVGNFESLEDAAVARRAAEEKYWGVLAP